MGFSQAYVVVVTSAATCLPIHSHSLSNVSNDTTADHITRLKVLDKTLKTLKLHISVALTVRLLCSDCTATCFMPDTPHPRSSNK